MRSLLLISSRFKPVFQNDTQQHLQAESSILLVIGLFIGAHGDQSLQGTA